MRSYLRSFVLLLPAALFFSSCGEDVYPAEQLPAATQQGSNAAGCLVNGNVWLPSSQLFGPKPIIVNVIRNRAFYAPNGPDGFQLSISMLRLPQEDRNMANTNTNISLYLPIIERTGRFALTDYVPRLFPGDWPAYGSFFSYAGDASNSYYTGAGILPSTGEIIITRFDTVGRVVSGTFDFTAGKASSTQQIWVTEGRFDVRY